MPIMNTVIAGGGTTPTGTISITSNGTHDVTNYANASVQVPTTAPTYYIEKQLDANNALVPGSNMIALPAKIGENGLSYAYYKNPNITGSLSLSAITQIDNYGLEGAFIGTPITSVSMTNPVVFVSSTQYFPEKCNHFKETFKDCTNLVSADLSGITTVNSSSYTPLYNVFVSTFYGCAALASVDLHNLSSVYSGNPSFGDNWIFYSTFFGTGLTSISLPNLRYIGPESFKQTFMSCGQLVSASIGVEEMQDNSYGCTAGLFQSCTALTSLDVSKLQKISSPSTNDSGGAFASALYSCTSMTVMKFESLWDLTESQGLSIGFGFCRSTTGLHIYFPSLTTTSFGGYTNHFKSMCYRATNVTLHFPSNIQSLIEGMTGYNATKPFSATSGSVVFDLPATVTLTGANTNTYKRNPKYDTATALGWRDSTDTSWSPVYTSGTSDPAVSDTIYSDSACTTAVTTIDSIA